MTKQNGADELGKRIEQLVAEHIAASRRGAEAAVARAFAKAGGTPPQRRSARETKPSAGQHRRESTEIAALGERFYKALCAKPGERMAVLAVDVGVGARELHRAVTLLRRAGRVRAVGQRLQTRYFPTVAK